MSEEKNNEDLNELFDLAHDEEHDCSTCPGCKTGCSCEDEEEEK
ncbi:MAG: hypothetical protein PF488_01345 [Patescibacteria group bacterium]|jgi:hypothetical protein|nr:hypothetical protein [Patescibacteria group bacterium]